MKPLQNFTDGQANVYEVADTMHSISTQTNIVDSVATVSFAASLDTRASSAVLRGTGQLPFRLPDRDRLYVAIFGDNPLLMQSHVEQSGGRVVYTATAGNCTWNRRSEIQQAFRRHTGDSRKTLVWIHWGEGLHLSRGRTRRETLQGCSAWLTRQAAEGGLAFFNSMANHWPFKTSSKWSETAKDVASCLIGVSGPCRTFRYCSIFVDAEMACRCKVPVMGDSESGTADCMNLFVGLVKQIFSHPMVFKETNRDILEDVGGEVPPTPVQAYPTEQAVRQKKAKAQYKEDLKSQGLTPEEIKQRTRKKPQIQEKHYDDCGSDVSPLLENNERVLLCLGHSTLSDLVHHCFMEEETGRMSESDEDYTTTTLDMSWNFLLSSEIDEGHACFVQKIAGSTFIPIDCVVSYLTHSALKGNVDVMEVVGGMGGVSRLAIRRRLVTGKNFDLVTGCDLECDKDFRSVTDYVEKFRPKVLVGGPPCTAFSSWSRLHRIKNPTQYASVRATGVKLAGRFARLCKMQINHGNYFVMENPRGS